MNIKEKLASDYSHSFDDGCILEADLGPPTILDRLMMMAAFKAGFDKCKELLEEKWTTGSYELEDYLLDDLREIGDEEYQRDK